MNLFFRKNDPRARQDTIETAPIVQEEPVSAESPMDKDRNSIASNGKKNKNDRQPELIRVIGKNSSFANPRGLDVSTLREKYLSDPVGFLQLLAEISPFLSGTIRTALHLAFGEGRFTITVRDEDGQILQNETAEAIAFLNNQPLSVGKPKQFFGKLLQEMMFFADGAAFEGVGYSNDPDGSMGYAYFKPFSTNSLNIGVNALGEETLYQTRRDGTEKELRTPHIFWTPNDPSVNSPNGKYAMASGAIEGLGELLTARNLRDGVRAAGNPLRMIRYKRDAILRAALEAVGATLRTKKVNDWIDAEIKKLETYAQERRSADTIVVADDVSAGNVEPADFRRVVPALESLWARSAISFGTFGTLLGFGEATKGSLQYQLVASYVASKRSEVFQLVEGGMDKHFILQGKIVHTTIEAPAVHLTDELVAQNAEQMKFLNALMRYAVGFDDYEDFCKAITGHKSRGKQIDNVIETLLKIAHSGGVDKNDSRQTNKSNGTPGKNPGNPQEGTQ